MYLEIFVKKYTVPKEYILILVYLSSRVYLFFLVHETHVGKIHWPKYVHFKVKIGKKDQFFVVVRTNLGVKLV